MSELGDWISTLQSQGAFTRPDGETPIPMEKQPVTGTPVPVSAIPEPVPGVIQNAPGSEGGPATPSMNPLLRNFLLQNQSGHNVLTDEMYNYFGGDQILEALRQYDPNAATMAIAGDENNGYRGGRTINFDPSKLPGITLPNGETMGFGAGPQFEAMYTGDDGFYRNPNMYVDDPIYGRVTPSTNKAPQEAKWWETAAPIAISLLAPMAGAALAAGGIGAAGGTAAVTGGAAGLGAANIAGGLTGGAASPWWAKPLTKAPQYARQLSNGNFNPAGLAGAGAEALGLPAGMGTAAGAAYNMFKPQPKQPGYNPQAMAKQGSAKKFNNGSSLVATQFAPNAYKNSGSGYNG